MPTVTAATVAEAVADLLVAEDVGDIGTVAREYVPQFELAELKTARVTVVPRGMRIERATRAEDYRDVDVDVAVQAYLPDRANTAIDTWLANVATVLDVVRDNPVLVVSEAGSEIASLLRVNVEPLFVPQHLDQMSVFTSVITATYRLV